MIQIQGQFFHYFYHATGEPLFYTRYQRYNTEHSDKNHCVRYNQEKVVDSGKDQEEKIVTE